MEIVGSDPKNFGCVYCRSHDRERHLFMYFDKLGLWDNFRGAAVLHFAPERKLSQKIVEQRPASYIKADLNPKDTGTEKVNVTRIQFSDNTFDVVLCNHVLEHISDYQQAMREMYRVLKPNGSAILQTPYSKEIQCNLEIEGINTDHLRTSFYGQFDHLRIFSEKHFFSDLERTGFVLHIANHGEYFTKEQSRLYGVNPREDLVRVVKPGS